MDNLKNIERTKHEIEHRAAHVLSTVIRGVEAAVSIGTILRYMDRGPTFRWLGIGRRRSPWETIGLIGAGMVAGAGLSMLLSPVSGRETREGIARGVRGIGQKGKEVLETAEKEIAELGSGEHDVEKQAISGRGEQRTGIQGMGSQAKNEGVGGMRQSGEGGKTNEGNANRGEGNKAHRPS